MRGWIGSALLIALVLGGAFGIFRWKEARERTAAAASAHLPEPMESVVVATAETREHRRTATAIGTILALQSITLRNEVAGTVHHVGLVPGQVVEKGALLVGFDVSVEEAELRALLAQAALAETVLGRMKRASENKAASEVEVDRARAERDVALANIERTRAVIARKTIRAPFRARVGLADLHAGQYLNAGTELTTLQGVDDAVHVDFAVNQQVVRGLRPGDPVEVVLGVSPPIEARIVAIDARIDAATRNANVRALIEGSASAPAPGASVRVRVPAGPARQVVAVPVNALRRGPSGDHVFVITRDRDGRPRAFARQVSSGPIVGDDVLIDGGLSAGEEVAVSGSFKLRDGVLVAIAGAPPAVESRASNGR